MLTLFSEGTLMHPRRALALTLVVPLLLAGCSDDPEPTPKIPDPTATSATPSPTVSETAEVESAEDFIRRWATVEADMENSGATAEYRAISKGCMACHDLADLIEKWYAAGGYVEWGGWRIQSIEPMGGYDEFVVRVRSSPTTYKESAQGSVKTFDGGPGVHTLTLEQRDDSWLVVRKAVVPR